MKRRQFIGKSLVASSTLSLPTLGQDISKSKERPNKYVLTKLDTDRLNEHFGGGTKNLLKLSGKDTGGDMAIFEVYSAENTRGPMLHIHHKQDEHITIMEGEYIYQVGEERIRLKAGDNLFLPRGIPHGFIHIGKGLGRKMSIFQPAGQIEDFFRALGKESPPFTAQKMQGLMAVNDMEVAGPPIQGE